MPLPTFCFTTLEAAGKSCSLIHSYPLVKLNNIQGPVVRKSVNANPGLKVKRGFDFCCIKAYIKANVLWGFTLVKGKTEGNKI